MAKSKKYENDSKKKVIYRSYKGGISSSAGFSLNRPIKLIRIASPNALKKRGTRSGGPKNHLNGTE